MTEALEVTSIRNTKHVNKKGKQPQKPYAHGNYLM